MRINNLYLHIEMGSSSSKVTPVRQESENRSSDDQNRVTRSLSNRIKELERQLKLKDETSLKVQEKLSAAERQVDALTTEVSQLQDCLDAIKTNPCKSCSALEHMVSKLEGELSLAKNGLEEMESSHEKRLQRVRSLSAKSQAESALSLFELRDENQRLTQENTKLLEQARQDREPSTDGSCGHMGLIIDLSQQLSAQEAELSKAREALKRLGADNS